MVTKMNGLSRDMIIHPGETLAEVLMDRDMSQKELAQRTGKTEKHISGVIRGKNSVTTNFARDLEYVLSIKSSFWINLQKKYDEELAKFEEFHQISNDEISIVKLLKSIVDHMESIGLLENDVDDVYRVIDLRYLLNVSNLTLIPLITYNAAYRAQTKSNVDVYVMFAWQRLCELLTKDIQVSEELNLERLQSKIPEIKQLMFSEPNKARIELTRIFAECGIAFNIVKHFKGAPVQGFIKKIEDGRLILCMTIRPGYADRFWFTLFHEIGHILNDDVKHKFIDFDKVQSEQEERADEFAGKTLIDPMAYEMFIKQKDFSLDSIRSFANSQNIPTYIVLGRLKHQHYISWSDFNQEMTRYKWAE